MLRHRSLSNISVNAETELCCTPVLEAPLERAVAEQLATLLKALADPARLQLLSLIASHAEGERCECELIEPLGLKQPTVSHHLKVLVSAGLLERQQRGVWAYYRVVPQRLASIREALELPEARLA